MDQRTHIKYDFRFGEVLNVNKPVGWTSFDVVNKLKRTFNIPKIGHAGTLDPFASGVLIILTGKYTKKAQYFTDLEKEYDGEIELGLSTDTLDVDGKVIQKGSIKAVTPKKILEVCASFVGEIMQTPPMYSAIKWRGRRLYDLARAGRNIRIRPRAVRIYKLDVAHIELPLVRIRVVCSKGTYIRALARDIGYRLGCGAYLRSLTRTRIGDFRLEDSLNIDDLVKSEAFAAD